MGQASRYILPYFVESKLWKAHLESTVNNYSHWVLNDPIRARRMFAALGTMQKGYTVQEYLYDMIECLYGSKLAQATKIRLYNEIDELEQLHEAANTIEDEL